MAGVRALHLSPASGVGVGLATQREAPDWIHIGLTVGGGKKKKKAKQNTGAAARQVKSGSWWPDREQQGAGAWLGASVGGDFLAYLPGIHNLDLQQKSLSLVFKLRPTLEMRITVFLTIGEIFVKVDSKTGR